jgi:hypothetical protein
MHAHGVLPVFGPQAEGVVAQVLARLDVVLVGIGPVQLHFLALVGDGIDARPVNAPAQKIALGVVATEKAVEMVIDLGFECLQVHRSFGKACPQLLDLGQRLRVGIERASLFNRLGQFLLERRLVRRLVLGKGGLDLRQQVLVQKSRDLLCTGVQDTVDAEVEVRLIKLE